MANPRAVLRFAVAICVLWTVYAKAAGPKFEEPMCSKYHFEEQVLEKLVRLEFKVEKSVAAVQDELSEVKDEQKVLKSTQEQEREVVTEEFSGIKNELNDLKAAQEKTDEDVAKLKADLDANKAAEKAEHAKLKADLLAEISTTQKSERVAFVARNPPQKFPPQGVIIFATLVLNLGDAYSSSTGKFTAPVSGTYLFTVHICPENYAGYQIIVNDNIVGVSHNDEGEASGVCSSMTTVAVMKSGEQAWIMNVNFSGSRLNADHTQTYGWNMFSGVLL